MASAEDRSVRKGSNRVRHGELRIAIDTGGTFTDCVWLLRGEIQTLKVFSTPDDPSRAIAAALKQIVDRLGVLPDKPAAHPEIVLLHGTTVGTNALLQRKGARVALITTYGFEDVIEIGRQARTRLYDFFFDRVGPLVSKEMRFGLAERVDSSGRVLQAPEQPELARLKESVATSGAQSFAVSLLFSFANPKNELIVAKALESLGKPLSISHRILPEFREFERTVTVVVNAYLQPLMQKYMERLRRRVEEFSALSARKQYVKTPRIFVMQSNGGITALQSAAREPVRTVLSGPAGGLVGTAAVAARSGFDRILTFDMGGTSTDVAAIQGEVRTGGQAEVAGFPIAVPMLDIHTVGAGGGSLARFDAGGALRVGPESAGSDPGPICYGRGTEPTVADANLLMGRLRPDRFLGGDFRLDLERARSITAAWLKKTISRLTVEQFVEGVVKVVNANMERALRVVSLERGYDPRDFALVAFGGAGPLHACGLAEALSISTVVIPARPGALSALGILMSDVMRDYSQTVLVPLARQRGMSAVDAAFSALERQAIREFRDEQWRGIPQFERSFDLRYRGQGYELNINAGKNPESRFHAEHQRRYGYHHADQAVELVTVRVRARLKNPSMKSTSPSRTKRPKISAARRSAVSEQARVLFGGRAIKTAIINRPDLQSGHVYRGPAIVTEYSATTVIPPKAKFRVDDAQNLVITI